MLDATVMWIIGAIIVLLPFVLMVVFNGTNQSDSRGRRISRTWRGRRLR